MEARPDRCRLPVVPADFGEGAGQEDTRLRWSIVLKDNGRHIGHIALDPIHVHDERAEMSLIIGEQDCRGCGYAREAARVLAEWAFRHRRLHRLTATVHAGNAPAVRAFEAAGFVDEGREQDHYRVGDGFEDAVRLSRFDARRPVRPIKPLEDVVLRGDRHTLVPFTEALVNERYVSWLNEPVVNQFLEVRRARQTLASGRTFVRSIRRDPLRYFWAVTEEPAREMIGTATLSLNPERESAELGLLIGERDRWGRGAANETIDLLSHFAFGHLGLQRVTGGTYSPNTGMNFTFRRLGFVREGVLRQSHRLDDGSRVDEYLWGIRVDEWKPKVALVLESPSA